MDSIAYKVQQFRKDIRPAMRCFHPLRVWNAVGHSFEFHNCGKCPYCLSLRATELACMWQLGAPLRAPITLGASVTLDPFI